MTAINIEQTDESISIFSDSAFVNAHDGLLASVGPKVIAFPAANCAMAITGLSQLTIQALYMFGSNADSFSKFLEIIVAEFNPILDQTISPNIAGFTVYIAGFSKDGERSIYCIEGTVRDRTFKLKRCCVDGSAIYSPALPLGVQARGLDALEVQRSNRVRDARLPNGSAYVIGGVCAGNDHFPRSH